MIKTKIILIHPPDPSTEFLDKIVSNLQKKLSNHTYFLNLESEKHFEFIQKALGSIYNEGDIILFLGHGRSNALYGFSADKKEKIILLKLEEVQEIIAKRKVVLFSCNSNQLLQKIGEDAIAYVGFGEMPTDWYEIMGERDIGDHRYLSKLTNTSLQKFREILVEMMIGAITFAVYNNNFARDIYLRLRMHLNIALIQVAESSIPLDERIELYGLIQRTKNELVYKD